MIDRSETWVSQVERGVRRIDRMTVLRTVADALGVPLSELAADTPVVAAMSRGRPTAAALRNLLASALWLSLAVSTQPSAPIAEPELSTAADEAWRLAHSASYTELVPLLIDLVPQAEAASHHADARHRRPYAAALARIYYACATVLGRLGETEAAWIAVDRAIRAAGRAGDPLLMAEGAFRLTLVFQAARRLAEADYAAASALAALAPLLEVGEPAALSVAGALHLQRATAAARANDPGAAEENLGRARALAERLGRDRNDYDTEFGPTNVAIQSVAIAIDLGDARTALRLAAGIDTRPMSPERRSRLLIDVARAHVQRRNPTDAVSALLDAERLTPDLVHSHQNVRTLVTDLARTGHRTPALADLASRCGIRLR